MKKIILLIFLCFLFLCFFSGGAYSKEKNSEFNERLKVLEDKSDRSNDKIKENTTKLNSLINAFQKRIVDSNDKININKKSIDTSKNEINSNKKSIDASENEINSTKKGLDSAILEIQSANKIIDDIKKDLSEQKIKTDENLAELRKTNKKILDKAKKTDNEISEIKKTNSDELKTITKSISDKTLYLIIAILVLVVFLIVLYLSARKKIRSSTHVLENQIKDTKQNLDDETIKLDSKLIELLEKQLASSSGNQNLVETEDEAPDHSLALKVGEEIHRMRKRIENMPEGTKGLGALSNSLARLEEQFNNNGYELVDLTGKPFVDGLTVSARFVPSDNLNPGEQIITKIIKPQVDFKGVLIQAAEVEVSTGE